MVSEYLVKGGSDLSAGNDVGGRVGSDFNLDGVLNSSGDSLDRSREGDHNDSSFLWASSGDGVTGVSAGEGERHAGATGADVGRDGHGRNSSGNIDSDLEGDGVSHGQATGDAGALGNVEAVWCGVSLVAEVVWDLSQSQGRHEGGNKQESEHVDWFGLLAVYRLSEEATVVLFNPDWGSFISV